MEDCRKHGTGVDFLFDFLSCKKFHWTRGPPGEGEEEAAKGSAFIDQGTSKRLGCGVAGNTALSGRQWRVS